MSTLVITLAPNVSSSPAFTASAGTSASIVTSLMVMVKCVALPGSTTAVCLTVLEDVPGAIALTDTAATEETATAAARAATKPFLLFIVNILLKINVNDSEQQYNITSVTSLSIIIRRKTLEIY